MILFSFQYLLELPNKLKNLHESSQLLGIAKAELVSREDQPKLYASHVEKAFSCLIQKSSASLSKAGEELESISVEDSTQLQAARDVLMKLRSTINSLNRRHSTIINEEVGSLYDFNAYAFEIVASKYTPNSIYKQRRV